MTVLKSRLSRTSIPVFSIFVSSLLLLCAVCKITIHYGADNITSQSLVQFPVEDSDERERSRVVSLKSNRTNNRVAVCVAGHVRTFTNPNVYKSILRHVIEPLHQDSKRIDVFFHLGNRDIPRFEKYRKKEAGNIASSEDEAILLEKTIKKFKPVSVTYYKNSPAYIDWSETEEGDGKQCLNGVLKEWFLPKTYSYPLLRGAQCFEKIRLHEEKAGFQYDFIYKIRPDVAYGNSVPVPSTLAKNKITINMHDPGASSHGLRWLRRTYPELKSYLQTPTADHMAFLPRSLADVYFRAYEAVKFCDQYSLSTLWFKKNPEFLLAYWLAKNKVNIEMRPVFWILWRENEGPECSRVRRIQRRLDRDAVVMVDREGVSYADRCEEYARNGIPLQ